MSTGSSDQSSEEMSDQHKDEGSAQVKKLDRDVLESKQGDEGYDRSQVEFNREGEEEEEEEDGQISSPANVRFEKRKANGLSSPMVEDTLGNGAGDRDFRDKELNGDSSVNLQYEKTEHAFDEVLDGGSGFTERDQYKDCESKKDASYYSSKSPQDSDRLEVRNPDLGSLEKTLNGSASPVRQMSVSHQKSLSAQETAGRRLSSSPRRGRDSSHSPRSPRRRPSASPAKRTSTSPGRRRQDFRQRDDPDRKCQIASPRKHYSPPDRRRKERLASRSPTRRRDSTSGYRRDNRDRSRSRSPYARDRRQRSPRRRYSPRRRSPPGNHSRHRSPRKRPWSPPPNRNTGIGKPGKNLFVAGFSFVTTEKDLERKFSRFGRVRDVRIVRDKRSGDSRGFGFLSLERDEDADAAIRALDQTQWNGRVVLVEKSKAPAN
ncbi:hypothetical protein MKW94_026152 [Papaver nudicaule]|uniref:RRM domain-containing protein n=1 Tax=Papaver nudicaule TaxID=74823 RepID=A0AA41UVR6_PAPNU|nr:hypothetical protein [Papaver nudicaule]